MITRAGHYRDEGPYAGMRDATMAAHRQHQHEAAPGTPIVVMQADGLTPRQVLMVAGDMDPAHREEVAELRVTTGT